MHLVTLSIAILGLDKSKKICVSAQRKGPTVGILKL